MFPRLEFIVTHRVSTLLVDLCNNALIQSIAHRKLSLILTKMAKTSAFNVLVSFLSVACYFLGRLYLLLEGLACRRLGKSHLWLFYFHTWKHLRKANILCLHEIGDYWPRGWLCRSHHCVVELHSLRWWIFWMRLMLMVCNKVWSTYAPRYRLWLCHCRFGLTSRQRDSRDVDCRSGYIGYWCRLSSGWRPFVSS